MSCRLRKTQKPRYQQSRGHGCFGKHQKHPGGLGHAGRVHRPRINFGKHNPCCFGKVSLRDYCIKSNSSFCPTVNLDKLWTWVSKDPRVNMARNKTRVALITHVVQSGYYGVLEQGELPKQPNSMKAKFSIMRAGERIKH
ncbi:60S ribosomal protein L27a-like [Neovison vison]|uniref:60S ribosomal protein L27a-like n=1 Tax=Neovison vison TaxID=452646 RepID=UPI001CF06895|nr:60S ribosomal protein L27a-like [Neogale vison]